MISSHNKRTVLLLHFLNLLTSLHISALKLSEVLKCSVTQCPTLCDTMDCSLPRFSVHGILQARILEWAAISLSRGSSQPRD